MKLIPITALASLTLQVTASPIGACSDLLSIVSLYTANQCANSEPFWMLSTRLDTWVTFLAENDGCQATNSTWDISSMRVGYLDEKCSSK